MGTARATGRFRLVSEALMSINTHTLAGQFHSRSKAQGRKSVGPPIIQFAKPSSKLEVQYLYLICEGTDMKWKRDVLFIGLVGGGLFALAFNLIPPRQTKAITTYHGEAYQKPEFQNSVERVNTSFRQQWSSENIR